MRRTYFSGTPCSLKHLQTSCRGTLYLDQWTPCAVPSASPGVSPSPASLQIWHQLSWHDTELLLSYASLTYLTTYLPPLLPSSSRPPLELHLVPSRFHFSFLSVPRPYNPQVSNICLFLKQLFTQSYTSIHWLFSVRMNTNYFPVTLL